MNTPSTYDVVVIGAGIVGSAIARELAGCELSVALLDARDDVCEGTSKANTAILHTGFDAKPGTLESSMVSRGYHLLSDYVRLTGIPVEHTGAVLVAWDQEQLDALPSLKEKAEANGYANDVWTLRRVAEVIERVLACPITRHASGTCASRLNWTWQ